MPVQQSFVDVPIAAVKNYWDSRPCNIRHSVKKLGSREYFDEVEARKYFVEPHIPGFAEFSRWRNKLVLEVGCGIGTDTINFARNGAYVTAVDLSEKSVDLARQRAAVYSVQDRIEFICGNAECLSELIAGKKFDLVYSFGVIHHTPNPATVLSHLKSFLAPDGELRIMVYSRVSYKLMWLMHTEGPWDMSAVDQILARSSEAQTGCPVTYSYTLTSVRELLSDFEIVDLRKAHIFTWDVEAYKNHTFKKDPAWARVNDDELAELEQELGWHLLVKCRLK